MLYTRHKVRHQILDHVNCLCDLKIWDIVHDYTKPDTDFLRQIRLDQNFQNVLVLQKIPKTINTLKVIALQLHRNDMLGRRETMLNKDWMTVKFEQISEKELSFMVHYCLFVDDTKVLLSVENPPS